MNISIDWQTASCCRNKNLLRLMAAFRGGLRSAPPERALSLLNPPKFHAVMIKNNNKNNTHYGRFPAICLRRKRVLRTPARRCSEGGLIV